MFFRIPEVGTSSSSWGKHEWSNMQLNDCMLHVWAAVLLNVQCVDFPQQSISPPPDAGTSGQVLAYLRQVTVIFLVQNLR